MNVLPNSANYTEVNDWFNPEWVAPGFLSRRNSVGVEVCLGGVTQGSPGSAGATLGFGTESRWDSWSLANVNASHTKGRQLGAGQAGLQPTVRPCSVARPRLWLPLLPPYLDRKSE